MGILAKLQITPGQWMVYTGHCFPGVNVITKSEWICEVGEAKNDGVRDDARLIAVAPEMLEALIEWCLYWEEHFGPSKRFKHTVYLIEKATGKTWEEIKGLICGN